MGMQAKLCPHQAHFALARESKASLLPLEESDGDRERLLMILVVDSVSRQPPQHRVHSSRSCTSRKRRSRAVSVLSAGVLLS